MIKPLTSLALCLALSGWNRPAACTPCVPSSRHETVKLEEKRQSVRGPAYQVKAIEHYNKAVALHQDGFLNSALSEYAAALALEPRMREALLNRASIFEAHGLYDKAADSIITALNTSPIDSFVADALARLAVVFDDDGQTSKAEVLYKRVYSCPLPKAPTERTKYRRTLVRYAQLLGREGKRDEAKHVNARVSRIPDR